MITYGLALLVIESDLFLSPPVKQLLIIDQAVEDKSLVYQVAGVDVDIREINSQQDGISQLKAILQEYKHLESLHVFSHARDGELYLGNTTVDANRLQQNFEILSVLDNSMENNADVLFYGCDLAKTEKGQDFLALISNNAHVDVAASNNKTGNFLLQGDWELEISQGNITTAPLFDAINMKSFTSVLTFNGGILFYNGTSGEFNTITHPVKDYSVSPAQDTPYTLIFQSSGTRADDLYINASLNYVEIAEKGPSTNNSVDMHFSQNEIFDLQHIEFNSRHTFEKTVKITSDKGGLVTANVVSHGSIIFDEADFAGSNWDGIKKITISYTDGTPIIKLKIYDISVAELQSTVVDSAPIASDVTFSGNMKEGQVLTGSYRYFDADADTESGSTLKWYRSNDETGVGKSAISSATSITYTLTPSDVGKYISFEVTPKNANGTGTSVESAINSNAVEGIPAITAASYDANTANLVVMGVSFQENSAAFDVDVSKLTLTGENGAAYTLTSSSDVEITSANQFSVTITGVDRLRINALFNKNGNSADDSTSYNIAAADNFITNVTEGDTSDATNIVTVSNYAIPTITSATYNASSKVLIVTGTNFGSLPGANNDIDVSQLSLVGNGGEYRFTSITDVDVLSLTKFRVALTDVDALNINGVLNKNGHSAGDSSNTIYNLKAAEDWQKAAAASVDIIDSGVNSVMVNGTATPMLTSATYDASSGVFVVTGTDLTKKIGTNNDIDVSQFTIKGQNGATRSLTSSDIEVTNNTHFTINLNAADKIAVNSLLNKNGRSSVNNVTYNLAADENWLIASDIGTSIADAINEIIANNVTDIDASISAGSGTDSTVIPTTANTTASAVNVYDININDGGTSDGKTTRISAVKFNVSGTATSLQRGNITWRLNGPDVSNVTGNYANNTLIFNGLNISVADGASENYTVNAYYNTTTGITDHASYILSVDGDTDVTVGNGTAMATTTPITNGVGMQAEVTATKLVVTIQPAGSISGVALSTQPVIAAQDVFGNIDTDFTETISLTEESSGVLINNTKAAVAGIATFNGVNYRASADQENFVLTANDEDNIDTDLPSVNTNTIVSDVVATRLVFTRQPSPLTLVSGIETTLTTVPIIKAQDSRGIIDTGFNKVIKLAEVGGAGDALITISNDADSDDATVSLIPTSGVATFSGMRLNYTAAGNSDETFKLIANASGILGAVSSQFNSSVINSDTRITEGIGIEASTLSTTINNASSAINVLDFTVTDGGSGDNKATNITAIAVHVAGTSTDIEREKISWRLNGARANQVVGNYDENTATIRFSNLTISVADGTQSTYSINAYYHDASGISDGHSFILSLDGDTDISLASNSTKIATSSVLTNGTTGVKADVSATKLIFTKQPAGSISGAALTIQPIVVAQDSAGNTDVDFTETITLSENSAGTLTNNRKSAIAGVATFNAVTYSASADQESFTLTANDEDNIAADFTTIDANLVISDVVATTLVLDNDLVPQVVNSQQNALDDSFTAYVNRFTQVPEVSARDAAGLLDLDYDDDITLSYNTNNAGNVTVLNATGDADSDSSLVTIAAVAGKAIFSEFTLTYTAASANDVVQLAISDASNATTNITSENIKVNILPYVIASTDSFNVNVDEDVKTTLFTSDIKLNDADDDELTVQLTVNKGLLFAIDGDTTIDLDDDSATSSDIVTISGSNGETGSMEITLKGKATNVTSFLDSARFRYQTAENDTSTPILTISAKDSTDVDTIKLVENINVTAINDAPKISGVPITSVNQDANYSFMPTASDVDNIASELSFSITNKPSWANFDSATGALTGTPTNADVGISSSVTISVTDGSLTTNLPAFDIEVVNVNDIPTVSSQTVTTVEDTVKTLTLLAADIDGDSLTYTYTAPINGTLSGTAPALTYIPQENFYGNDSITFKVNDGMAESATGRVTIMVTAVNDAPKISGTPARNIVQDSVYSFTPTVSDVDNIASELSFSITNKPSWANFYSVTGALTGTPTNANIGTTSGIIISVSDGTEGMNLTTSLPAFNIEVKRINTAPISTDMIIEVEEDGSTSFTPEINDEEIDDILTLILKSQPSHGELKQHGNMLTYTPDSNYFGEDSFTFAGSDGKAESIPAIVSIKVTPVNDMPIANDDVITLVENTQYTYTLDVLANDNDVEDEVPALLGATTDIGHVSVVNGKLLLNLEASIHGHVNVQYVVNDTAGAESKGQAKISFTELSSAGLIYNKPEAKVINATGLFTKVYVQPPVVTDSNGERLTVTLHNDSLFFKPGNSQLQWQVIDNKGITSIITQMVQIYPLIDIRQNEQVAGNQAHSLTVYLNGQAPQYPVVIPYDVTGSRQNGTHDLVSGELVITGGRQGKIHYNTFGNVEVEETLTVTLAESLNRGGNASTTVVIKAGNMAPRADIIVMQGGEQRPFIDNNAGDVSLHVMQDENTQGNVKVSYDSNFPEEVELIGTETGMSFSPEDVAAGVYTLTITMVGEDDQSTIKTVYLEILDSLTELDTRDTDGNGIPDNIEGYSDKDGDGIADYLDSDDSCNVVPEQRQTNNAFLVEVEAGVCLRKTLFMINQQSEGILLNKEEVPVDTGYTNISGLFAFVTHNLPQVGGKAYIVIPQKAPITNNSVYRKYIKGSWGNFIENATDKVYSTRGDLGYCPAPKSSAWSLGLQDGAWCVQLAITDGGVNDADGVVNGAIVDPGGVATASDNLKSPVLNNNQIIDLVMNETVVVDVLNGVDDRDSLVIISASVDFGDVSIVDNNLVYITDDDFIGKAIITYGVKAVNGMTTYQTLTINVINSTAPIANTDSINVTSASSVIIDVLLNDTNAEGGVLSLISATAEYGQVIINSDNTLTYVPKRGFNGVDIIVYKIENIQKNQATGQVNVTVAAYETITVTNTSSGGGSIGVVILSLLALLVLVKRQQQRSAFMLLLASLVLSTGANATENITEEMKNEQWSISAAVGQARVNNTQITNIDSNTRILTLDEIAVSWSVGTFYQFENNVKVGVRYIDLGEGKLVLASDTLNPTELHQQVANMAPVFAKGIALELGYGYIINDSLRVNVFAGIFHHQLNVNSQATGLSNINSKEKDSQPYAGAELAYRLTGNVELFTQYSRYNLAVQAVNELAIGISVSF